MTQARPSEEFDLVRRAKRGDERALASLVARLDPPLRRRIYGRLSPSVRRKVSASDVLQQTWIVATQRLGDFEYRGDGSFGAWLGQIADHAAQKATRHYAGTAKRDAHLEVTRDPRRATADPPGREVSPGARAGEAELRDRIAGALARLPEDHRAVIELLQDRRMTIAEAASVMGRTENAVKKLHARALESMAKLLGLSTRDADGSR